MTSLDSSTAGLSSLEGKYDCVVVKSTLQTPVECTSDEEIAQNDNSIKYNDNYNSPLFKLHPILTTITPTAVGIETNLKPTENSLTECVDISTQQGNSLFLLNEQERGDKPTFVAPNISCMPPTTNGNFFPSALLPSPCYDLSNDMSLTSRSTECCDESVNSAESNNTSTNDDININNNNINNNTNNIPQVNELKNPSTTQAVSIEVLSEVPLERQPPHGSLVILALENSTDPKTLPLQEKPADTENSVSTENPTEDPSTPQKSKRQIIIGYILLVVALFAVSSLVRFLFYFLYSFILLFF